jgi:GT2 family glycosyltransferase
VKTIAIVVPCHDEPRRLDWNLSALAPQLAPRDVIVVVNDHSRTALPAPRHGSRLRIVSVETTAQAGNRSAARNAGWRACDADVVVFLDCDMVVGPGFLDGVRHAHAEVPRAVVKAARFNLTLVEQARGKAACLRSVGRQDRWAAEGLRALPYEARRPRYHGRARRLESTSRWAAMLPDDQALSDEWQGAASNAISVPHHLVSAVGGWDEGYTGWGEEDMDFAYRLHLAGARFLYPEPSCHYAVHLDHPVQPRKRDTLAHNALRFASKFPEVLSLRAPVYAHYGIRIQEDPTPELAPPQISRNVFFSISEGCPRRDVPALYDDPRRPTSAERLSFPVTMTPAGPRRRNVFLPISEGPERLS